MTQTNNRVREFLTRVGGPRMIDKLGVKDRMLRHVASKGVMPPSWYRAALEAANEAQIERPDLDMFDFKGKE